MFLEDLFFLALDVLKDTIGCTLDEIHDKECHERLKT